jgi:hypothetical protein
MSEEKFLAFKGLKQYDPGMGWAQVHNFNHTQSEEAAQTYSDINQQAAQTIAKASSEVLHDPLAGRTLRAVKPPRARRVGAKLESHCR